MIFLDSGTKSDYANIDGENDVVIDIIAVAAVVAAAVTVAEHSCMAMARTGNGFLVFAIAMELCSTTATTVAAVAATRQ